jgi:hypothetical protein
MSINNSVFGFLTIDEAIKKHQLDNTCLQKLIKNGFIHLRTHAGKVFLSSFSSVLLSSLCDNQQLMEELQGIEHSFSIDRHPEIIPYLPYHDFVDRFCWLIKFYYSEKIEVKTKRYKLDALLQRYLLKNEFSMEKLSKTLSINQDIKSLIFHIQKGWYNEIIRSTPLDPDFLNVGTNIKKVNYGESTTFSWNIIQSYYAIYEFTSSLVSSFYGDFNSEEHQKPAKLFNTCISDISKKSAIFFPFLFSSESLKNAIIYPDYLIKYKYSKHPRNSSKTIQDIESDVIDAFLALKQKKKTNHKVTLIDFMFDFRVWANYTGIETILELEDGGYLQFLKKNLGVLIFFYAAMSELCVIAKLGEPEFMKLVDRFSNGYLLKNPKLADNRFLIPLFVRLRIYKHMGFIKNDIPYLFPQLRDPVTLL